ncbi:DUF5675 family protein [Ferrimonas aestuarii]|uniref:DUF5675 domain-containing protein n=1 Tax=Ferrimonas aestuarii TaxID=2569539 RepID=A0A4U1BKW8_9GAMM|nr:DUF5675 family protein [Ferrimonas aestuarii]TKB53295.1 hypothetical protein FCL42_14580 [Ferrimonas aestuarii]
MRHLKLTTRGVPGVGTFGELTEQGQKLCVTVERDWNNNLPNISCVPAGEYTLRPHVSPRYGDCLVIEAPSLGVTATGPSQRSHCLIHPANWPDQLEGCIAPGLEFHPDRWGVKSSRTAFKRLMETITEPVKLTIVRH